MATAKQGKSQRRRLQRQLEFYLSESNLRQDKFLQQSMDEHGFVPVRVFLSFNRLKALKATERMILDEADKSAVIKVDRARSCIAPEALPVLGEDDEADARTIYIDSFSATDDHDSLRRTFSEFGKVNLVSLPRFSQSKKFKGFGFVEFSEQAAVERAISASTSTEASLNGIRAMSKARWLEMKEQLKEKLASSAAATASEDTQQDEKSSGGSPGNLQTKPSKDFDKTKKRKRQRPPPAEHVHFSDSDEEDYGGEAESHTDDGSGSQRSGEDSDKKQKLEQSVI